MMVKDIRIVHRSETERSLVLRELGRGNSSHPDILRCFLSSSMNELLECGAHG